MCLKKTDKTEFKFSPRIQCPLQKDISSFIPVTTIFELLTYPDGATLVVLSEKTGHEHPVSALLYNKDEMRSALTPYYLSIKKIRQPVLPVPALDNVLKQSLPANCMHFFVPSRRQAFCELPGLSQAKHFYGMVPAVPSCSI